MLKERSAAHGCSVSNSLLTNISTGAHRPREMVTTGPVGPTSQKLHDSIAQNLSDYRTQNGLATNAPVPADAVTSSGSGLDPHISPENARLQAPRVAKARGLALEKVQALIEKHTDSADIGVLGEPGVNVLELNLALDALSPSTASGPVAQVR